MLSRRLEAAYKTLAKDLPHYSEFFPIEFLFSSTPATYKSDNYPIFILSSPRHP